MSQPWYIQLLIAIGTAFFTAILTVNLALRRFYTERWWERKADVYSRIVDALHNYKNYDEKKVSDEYNDLSSSSKDDKLEQQWAEANKELKRAVDLGSFTISKEAEGIIQKFLQRKLPNFQEAPFVEIIEADLECVSMFKGN